MLCAMQGILVDRKDPDSRKKAVEAINEHANKSESTNLLLFFSLFLFFFFWVPKIGGRISAGEGWPQLLVFPEGTCTNQKALISFKAGAFNPGSILFLFFRAILFYDYS
jgi:hypothetical protein